MRSLFCRGGGSSFLNLDAGGTVVVDMEWGFKHSNQKYNPDTLAPGYCAWVSGAMKSSEPWYVYRREAVSGRYLRVSRTKSATRISLRKRNGERDTPIAIRGFDALSSANNIVEFRVRERTLDRRSTDGRKFKRKYVEAVEVVGVHRREDLRKG
ncbi:MAG: hypothetical protein AAF721_40160 [Myxococcota bacterium]